MPPSGKPIEDFPAFSNQAFGGPYAFNVDDLYPDNADDYLDLIQHPDSDSHGPKADGAGLFQHALTTPLPSNLSPTASDPDDSSDSSRSPKAAAMDTSDRMDLETTWDDFLNFGSDQTNPDTVNPADIDQPTGNGNPHFFMPTFFPEAERSSPAFDSSSPSESNSSSSAHNDSDESLPMAMEVKPSIVSIPPQAPLSRSKRLSVRCTAGSRILAFADRKQQHSSSSANGFSTIGSREVSPMSQMAYSQGPSPFNPSNSNFSWFDYPRPKVSPSTNPSSNGAMDETSLEAPGSAYFSRVQANPAASHKPTLTFFDMDPKSRVETQIKLFVALHPVPEGIKKIRLPPHTISKPKFLAKPSPPPQADTLQLSTQLVCTSAMQKPHLLERALARAAASGHMSDARVDSEEEKSENGGEVRICGGCVLREQKRANRKKNKKPDEDEDWKRYETARVIVFNTHEVKELKPPKPAHPTTPGTMEIDLPMRIACYCRHHHEKSGFQVIFTLKDHLGNVLTQALTPSIMITDDHKTPQSNPNHAGGADSTDSSAIPPAPNGTNDMNTIQPGHPFRHTQSTSDIQALKRSASSLVTPAVHSSNSSIMPSTAPTPRNLSRPPSPGIVGPSAKKRKSSGPKIPTTLHMTPIGANPFAQQAPSNLQNGGPGPGLSSSSTSPFSPPSSIPYSESNASAFTPPSNTGFTPGPQTPTSNEQLLFHPDTSRMANTDHRAVQQPLFPTPASTHNSRAPSPSSLINGALQQQSLNSLGQVSHMLNNGLPVGTAFQRQSMPDILKVLPTEGSTSGGIEISIFGSGFRQGQEVYFGDSRATTTTYWADSALTCLLPPYHQAGPVPVSVRGPNGQMLSLPRPSAQFLYKDESQDQLSALALGVLSHKLSGSTEHVREFIMRLLNFSGEDSSNGNNFNGGAPSGYTMNNPESQLLKVLDLLDMDDSVNKAKFNLKRKATGHTMLHLSVALGYHRFSAGLLARGANPNVRDVGGYTPLHYAAMHDHPELVRRLIQHRADPTLRTRQGLLASDVATTRDVIRAIKRAGRRGSTIHSRANSATSLRSLWEPPQRRASASSEFSYSETSSESDEILESSSEEELDAESPYLHMAPRSRRSQGAHSSRVSLVEVPQAEEQGGMPSAAVAIAAFKEQIQQFQQTMMQNLSQNLSHIQMPNMAALQDYQAYLNTAQQRMSAFIPNIGTLSAPSSSLPPAYDDIFPGGRQDGKTSTIEPHDLDTKTASAARAAADYEADRKYATLYDQQQETEQAESSVVMEQQAEERQVQRQLPKLLQIGRKNNITKEQQDNLRQARAEQQKGLSRDLKLFLFWVSGHKSS